MSVESATHVSQLNSNNPTGTDLKNEGDNHLRLLKQVMQNDLAEGNRQWVHMNININYVSTTTFTVSSATGFTIGRRCFASGGADRYFTISNVSGTTITASNISDSTGAGASLHASMNTVWLSIQDVDTNVSIVTNYPTLSIETGVTNTTYQYGDIRRYGGKWDGTTNDSAAFNNAMNSKVGFVLLPAGEGVLDTTITPIRGCRIIGKGDITRKSGELGSVLTVDTHYTTISTTLATTLFTINDWNFSIENVYIRQKGTDETGKCFDCSTGSPYYASFKNVTVDAFQYGVYAQKSLDHYHENCNYVNCDYGIYYYGSAGTWNTDWFNNRLVFDRCSFKTSTTTGAYVKGMGTTFLSCDADGSDIGYHILGDTGGSAAFGNSLIECYWANGTTPFKFTNYARATIHGGYVEGESVAVVGSSIIEADDNSQVFVKGRINSQSNFDDRVLLTNTSIVHLDYELDGASTDSIDGTSFVYTNFRGTNENIATTGHQKLPSGLILQWGVKTGKAYSDQTLDTVTYDITFPNAVYYITGISDGSSASIVEIGTITTSDTEFVISQRSGTSGSYANLYWFAIGY